VELVGRHHRRRIGWSPYAVFMRQQSGRRASALAGLWAHAAWNECPLRVPNDLNGCKSRGGHKGVIPHASQDVDSGDSNSAQHGWCTGIGFEPERLRHDCPVHRPQTNCHSDTMKWRRVTRSIINVRDTDRAKKTCRALRSR